MSAGSDGVFNESRVSVECSQLISLKDLHSHLLSLSSPRNGILILIDLVLHYYQLSNNEHGCPHSDKESHLQCLA